MIDSCLTAQRDAKAAKAFLNKAIEPVRLHRQAAICTDNASTYRRVIRESDPATRKHLLDCRQSFRSLRTAEASLMGNKTKSHYQTRSYPQQTARH
jgi:IS6 family transposase